MWCPGYSSLPARPTPFRLVQTCRLAPRVEKALRRFLEKVHAWLFLESQVEAPGKRSVARLFRPWLRQRKNSEESSCMLLAVERWRPNPHCEEACETPASKYRWKACFPQSGLSTHCDRQM